MAVFARTVETGSFRAAARALGLSPSVVSHHVAQLEARLGVALLYRSTRRLTLTSDGSKLFEAARTMLEAAEGGLDQIAERSREPAGHLSVTAPEVFVSGRVVDGLAAFARAFPKVTLSVSFTDMPLDLIRDGIDLAVRVGALADSSLKSKRLFAMPLKLVAAPAYVSERRTPRGPRDLIDWDWMSLKSRRPRDKFVGPGGRTEVIEFSPRIVVDSAQAALELARHGQGLAMVPAAIAAPLLARRELIEVLPKWRLEAPSVYAVWPPNASRAGLAMRLVAMLEDRPKK